MRSVSTMSKLKDNLPESLELLLDTMCNTFGGIMFIALSLVIISQLVTDKIVSEAPEKVDQEEIEVLERSVAVLQTESLENQQKIQSFNDAQQRITPELKKLINEIKQMKLINLEAEVISENLSEQLKKQLEEEKALKKEIASLKQQRKRNAARTEQEKKEMERELAKKAKELENLEKLLASTKSKTVTFSMEEDTYMLPYVVIIKKDSIYRMGSSWQNPVSDVTVSLDGKKLIIIPKSGTALGNSPEVTLEKLFGQINKSSYFIWLISDENSFHTLRSTREFLRKQGFKVRWDINIELYIGNGSHKASF